MALQTDYLVKGCGAMAMAFVDARKRLVGATMTNTAIDSVSCLLANGALPQSITWVLPRDPWLLKLVSAPP